MPEDWIQIYFNQKDINYISPSNIRASVETPLSPVTQFPLQFSPSSVPDILWASPLSFTSLCDKHILVHKVILYKGRTALTINYTQIRVKP